MQKIYKKCLKIESFVVLAFTSIYVFAASVVSLNRYWQFDAFWYDFGILDETIWKLSRFQLPYIPSKLPPQGIIVWGDHLNPSAALLAPLYWLTDRPEITLIAQAIIIGLSALVFYLIARKIIESSLVRISLLVSYLGFVGTQNALYTDIHNIVFAVLPLSLTFWAVYNKNWKLYWLFLALTLGFQENLSAVGIGIGIFLMLRKDKEIKIGLITVILSLVYGLLATKVIMPFFAGVYSYEPVLPSKWSGWITGFVDPPELKVKAIVATFATFGFVPIFSLPTLPLVFEHFLERFVLNIARSRWDLGFHYNALLSPIMTVASFEVLRRIQVKEKLKKALPFWAIGTILMVIFLHRFYLHGPLMLATIPAFYEQTTRAKYHEDFISKVPKNGLIMAQNNLAAHLTHYNVTLLNPDYGRIKPDWVVIDLRSGQNPNNFYPISYEEMINLVRRLSSEKGYKKYLEENEQIIFQRLE